MYITACEVLEGGSKREASVKYDSEVIGEEKTSVCSQASILLATILD